MTGTAFDLIIAGLIGAAPGIALGLWALAKAYAAASEALWDDEAVAFVEKIAQGVVDNKPAPTVSK